MNEIYGLELHIPVFIEKKEYYYSLYRLFNDAENYLEKYYFYDYFFNKNTKTDDFFKWKFDNESLKYENSSFGILELAGTNILEFVIDIQFKNEAQRKSFHNDFFDSVNKDFFIQIKNKIEQFIIVNNISRYVRCVEVFDAIPTLDYHTIVYDEKELNAGKENYSDIEIATYDVVTVEACYYVITKAIDRLNEFAGELLNKSSSKNNKFARKIVEVEKMYLNYEYINTNQLKDFESGYKEYKENHIYKLFEETKHLETIYKDTITHIKDVMDLEHQVEDTSLANFLNIIQIASVLLTIIGWIIVVYEGNIKYLIAVAIGAILSILLAFLLNKFINRNN